MESKRDQVMSMWLEGKPATEIADAIGLKRARVYQLLKEARESGAYTVHVTVQDARGVEIKPVAIYLRRALAQAGITTHKAEEG